MWGGTHIKNTSDIWHFKISSESAVAAGIRRIEAITGEVALIYFEQKSQVLDEVNNLFKNPQNPFKAVKQIQAENNSLKKELNKLKKLKSKILVDEIKLEIEDINGIAFFGKGC